MSQEEHCRWCYKVIQFLAGHGWVHAQTGSRYCGSSYHTAKPQLDSNSHTV